MPPHRELILWRAYCSRTPSLFAKRERSHFQANDRFDPLITLSRDFREQRLRVTITHSSEAGKVR